MKLEDKEKTLMAAELEVNALNRKVEKQKGQFCGPGREEKYKFE